MKLFAGVIGPVVCLARQVAGEMGETAAAPRSSFENQLVARQLGLDFGCGLNLNAFGRVAPLKASGQANLCLQCRFNVLGIISLDFSFLNSLTSTINTNGVSASDASVLQSHLQGLLQTKATQQRTSAECQAAFANDKRCASSKFVNGRCQATAIDCVRNNKNGPVLAQAFQSLFRTGGPSYCSICSGDKSCTNPSARARRSLPEKSAAYKPRCPSGLTACPISAVKEFMPSTPYECLDTQQEINSCGGCVTLGNGTNCALLRGAGMSGCSDGKCTIFSCARGFKYSKRDQSCRRMHPQHQSLSRSHHS
ncbi:hypothetical protein PTTG_12311 [Puccinia triticina 1-1 BBBD Race 1]|uniref:Protein CPL1-like domain-containing protein n=2 Tax=Puccinia triticina TaxID=208348 RepID=A0A180GGP4_PUCT1|nr:uncharacterized protein PtA15_8A78 [Puccinia triticina]OAV91845.1 hypothetical protein PTTG_12311 [Puccinia triticina 1-1 BBBD Race 1]WAQ87177.1 hypothetical protein PtA15_8A78 [Puccinia triticina]